VRVATLAFVPRRASTPETRAGDDVPAGRTTARRGVVLAVARGRESLDPLLARMRLATLGIGAIAALLCAALVWRALAAGFRPIDAIAAQVGAIDAERLGARVAAARTPAELAPVVTQVNALLARLDEAFERERRFTGHVAHELRTPIAELRNLAAVGSRWPGDETSVARFFDDVGDVAKRMERLVADLLLLARCQAGVEPVRGVRTPLREAVLSAWSMLSPAARAAAPSLRLDVPADLEVESDPDKLSILLGNVLGNAVAHARASGEVRCVARREPGGFRLAVENAAEPLTAEELAHVAEPFWRKDAARSPGEHAGLGLALVSAVASLLRLDVAYEQDADGTFRVRIHGRALPGGHPVEAAPLSAS
jgi:signal transduction histidine kinase